MLFSIIALALVQTTHALYQNFPKSVAPRRVNVGLSALKLYGNQGTRSPLVNWYLEELGVPYENIDAQTVDRTSDTYPNPFRSIPAASDSDGVELFESGAILLYIADKYGGLDTPERRAAVAKWVVWANASLDPICFVENDRGQVLDTKLKKEPKQLYVLDKLLAQSSWLVDGTFSAADVAVGSYILYVLLFFPQVKIAGKWPHVGAFAAACASRPAYAKAYGASTAAKLAELARRT